MLLKQLAFLGLLATSAVAAQCDPNKVKSLEYRSEPVTDDVDIEARDVGADETEETITTISLEDDDTPDKTNVDANNPVVQAQNHCSNCAKIKKKKARFGKNCDPAKSLGWKSSHNCKGTSYLCVQGGKATCYSRPLNKLNMENGECFK
ncbi:hypothetical protein BDV25DRAFT_112730 [Aspergillus avenaceus]|uniref:Uncharacterized protein n=1 Tax=Aspergillus avenaceus TaxID=36643 RepID=A0A5N6TVN4_ASPAV|nr:hypothetical protein BDV25DRAFT_112730 [Aspergillus avenaceus]